MNSVTCGIPTRDRYDLLALTLLSVVNQTRKPDEVIIVDDGARADIREMPGIAPTLHLFDHYKIAWKVLFGSGRGQHISHQLIQDQAEGDFIWRIDDDEWAEPNALQRLLQVAISHDSQKVGAVGGLVLVPPPQMVPIHDSKIFADLNWNAQWYLYPKNQKPFEVEHLTSTFLYRKGIAKFEPSLSPAAHREETLFTFELKRAGYKLLVAPDAITWHYRAAHGGIRSHRDMSYWDNDERFFQEKLKEWGVNGPSSKTIVLDTGKGDHVVFKKLIPELKEKYGKLMIAACYPDVFEDDEVQLISIADAKMRFGDLDRFNIYKAMIDWQWDKSLEKAYRAMYL